MHSSVQEGVKYLFQKSTWSNKSLQNADSTDFSTKSAPDSLESGPHEKKKGSSSSIKILAKDVVNVFGGCFVQSKREKQDDESSFKDISVTSTSTNTSLLQSSGSSNSAAYSFNEGLKEGSEIVTFTMNELVRATGNFSPSLKIGQGGFGTVYRGKLSNGRLVAVKRAKKNASDKQLSAEFQNELATLASVEHLNLVKFIGYLEEQNERILVVEYVSNGNLREHLDGLYGVVLDLATRLDIIIDVAHALTYLHLYADRSIIHRDIKSSNILLTENFRAKVADFGFSRLAPWEVDATHVSTQVKGTAGYLDPEYLKTYQLTQKSDVYSFGVLLVEIITGRRPIEQKREVKERITTRWAFQMFLDGKAIEILDSKLEKTSAAYLMVEKLLELAFQCAAPTRKERPSMKKTVELLWNIRKDYREVLQEQPPQQPL